MHEESTDTICSEKMNSTKHSEVDGFGRALTK